MTWAKRHGGWIGLGVAAALEGLLAGVQPPGLTPAGRHTAAVGAWMAILWMTEALPLAATALMPVVWFPLLGITSLRQATAPYAHELVFLFLGGFLIAQAMQRWDLHRRLALALTAYLGRSPSGLVLGFMLASALLSMWISNTATAALMLPIGLGVLDGQRGAGDVQGADGGPSSFDTCLMLGIAYGASIGGIATLVGSPPNLLAAAYLRESHGIEVGFGRWMAVGLPTAAVFLPAAWWVLTRFVHRLHASTSPRFDARQVAAARAALGPMGRGERAVLLVFAATASAWILRQPVQSISAIMERFPFLERVSDAGIAVAAALVLFALPADRRRGIPVLDWDAARQLPWGTLLLFGGGLSLAAAFRASGLSAWLAGAAHGLASQPAWLLVTAVVGLVVFLTEITSNTATTATFVPLLGALAVGAGIRVPELVLPAALAASFAFMLPVATPPNAIVFGSGRVPMRAMLRAGLVLNMLGILLLVLVAEGPVRWLWGR